MEFEFAEWKPCATDKPDKDGFYAVVGVDIKANQVFYVAGINYMTEYGWNTYSQCHDNPLDFSKTSDSRYMYFWSKASCRGTTND